MEGQGEREQFINHIKKCDVSSLLEIGAGMGRESLYFQERGLDVTCVDLSDELVKLCRSKNLNAHVMDFYNLQFPDQSFVRCLL